MVLMLHQPTGKAIIQITSLLDADGYSSTLVTRKSTGSLKQLSQTKRQKPRPS